MIVMKTKKKIKGRKRTFNRDAFYNNRPLSEVVRMKFAIEKAFPNIQERNDYVNSLIECME